jgi:hypothetical protein
MVSPLTVGIQVVNVRLLLWPAGAGAPGIEISLTESPLSMTPRNPASNDALEDAIAVLPNPPQYGTVSDLFASSLVAGLAGGDLVASPPP